MKKILMIGDNGPLVFAQSFRKSFENLGYIVDEPEYLVFKEQNFILKRFKYLRAQYLGAFFAKQTALYINKLEKFNPDAVFVFNNNRITLEFAQYCCAKKLPMYLYLCDSIHFTSKAYEYRDFYEAIYSYEPTDAKVSFGEGKYVKYMPLGCDHEVYRHMSEIKKRYDICFVGNLDKRRFEILEKVAEYCQKNNKKMVVHTLLQLNINGKWDHIPKVVGRRIRYYKKYHHLMKYIVNKPIFGRDLAKLYNESRINLNIHVGTDLGLHTGPNPRTFEILGTKGFEIMDSGHLLDLPFYDGKDLVVFDDTDDLLKKIDYYLQYENERDIISSNGQKKVLNMMTIQKQVEEICKDIEGM